MMLCIGLHHSSAVCQYMFSTDTVLHYSYVERCFCLSFWIC